MHLHKIRWDLAGSLTLHLSLNVKLAQAVLDLQREMRDRFASKSRIADTSPLHVATGAPTGTSGMGFFAGEAMSDEAGTKNAFNGRPGSGNGTSSSSKNSALLDEVQFSMQKLKRELVDLKAANAKLVLANSQLEDDVAHLQRKYEEEKRAHLNGKKLHIPKVQKVGIVREHCVFGSGLEFGWWSGYLLTLCCALTG